MVVLFHGNSEDVAFIACIAPRDEYIAWDFGFWRIVWKEKCSVIVMLNKLEENDYGKLSQYWPDKTRTKEFGSLFVTCIGECVNDTLGYVLRTFEIKETSYSNTDTEPVVVKQFQYLGWSEGGAAENVPNLLKFRNIVNGAKLADRGPIVVHSRKGIGRTGTYIALDLLLQTVDAMGDSAEKTTVDIYLCVKHLREQRVRMVDTVKQYTFLYDALAYYLHIKAENEPGSNATV